MNRPSIPFILFLASLFLPAGVTLGADKSQRVEVSIQGLQFAPSVLSIHVGDTVVWTDNDDRDYNVVSSDGSFSSGNLRNGQTFEHVFSQAGKFTYACSYHPRMKGTVTVAP